jgi:hypothetical protein
VSGYGLDDQVIISSGFYSCGYSQSEMSYEHGPILRGYGAREKIEILTAQNKVADVL